MYNDKIVVHGIVLSSVPVGEADRRLVILTGERGRMTAFAKGARRPNSQFVASTRAFTYGEMTIFEGRNSNNLESIDPENFFEGVVKSLDSSCYASYFAEFTDYYAREGLEAKDMVNLLYASLLALEKDRIPRPLIRSIFELKLMTLNGEYSELPLDENLVKIATSDEASARRDIFLACLQAWKHVVSCDIATAFSFTLSAEAMMLFTREVGRLREHFVEREFKSLEMLEVMG